ncbi:MAG: hypothetical protein H6706_30565 [Myxococcales bacterium]|nr:hypothetical protein [Myxococcales bacterium]
MTRLLRTSLALASTLALAACDDDGGGAKTSAVEDPGTVQAGKTTGQQSAALTMVQPMAGAEGAQGQFGQVSSALQGFVSQYQSFKASQQAGAQGGQPAGAQGFPLEVARQNQAVANSFSYDGGHLVAQVTYNANGTSLFYDVDLQIDAAETGGFSIDGDFHVDFATAQAMYEVTYNLDASYGAFQLDGTGCPVGGTITVNYDITVGGAFLDSLPPESRAQIADQVAAGGRLVATYGPACGDVAVEGT